MSGEAAGSRAAAGILLVDDSRENLTALAAVLEPLEENLVTARSGREALARLLEERFAVILLDVHMPDMDGFETASLIRGRERTRHIPIIFLTAVSTETRHVFRGYQAGAVDYLLKPVDPIILRSKVSVFLDLSRAQETLRRQEKELRRRELAEQERRGEERYRFLAEAIPQHVWRARADGALEYVSPRVLDYLGCAPDDLLGGDWAAHVHRADLEAHAAGWARALEAGEPHESEVRLLGADGAYRWHLMRAVPYRDEDGCVSGWVGTSTEIEGAKRSERMQRFLADLGAALEKAVDHWDTVEAVAALAIPKVADWLLLEPADGDGPFGEPAVIHPDPARAAIASDLRARLRREDRASPEDARRGLLVADASGDAVSALATDDAQRGLVRALGVGSYACVPLPAAGQRPGALTFVLGDSGRRYEDEDLALLEEVGRRVATALDAARAHALLGEALAEAEAAVERTRRLQELTGLLSGALTPAAVLEAVVRGGGRASGADAALAGRVTDDQSEIEVTAVGVPPEVLRRLTRVSIDAPLPGPAVVRDGQPRWRSRDREPDEFPAMRAIADSARWRASAHLPVFAGGAPAGFLGFHYEVERAFDDEERAFLSAIAGQCSQALERARLYEAERDLRTSAEAARGRAELLADVGIALDERDEGSKRMQPLVSALVPGLADVAMVVERRGDGQLGVAAASRHEAAGVDGSLPSTALPQDAERLLSPILDRGETRLLTSGARPPLAGLDDGPCLAVPLVASSGVIGALVLARVDAARAFVPADLELAHEVGVRAGLAIENARLFQRQRAIALELQHSLLGPPPPSRRDVRLASRYRPGETHLEVGGDWHDIIPLPDGHLGLVIGDVVGRGLRAATAMGQLRSATRALAPVSAGPRELLERLDAFARGVEAASFSTVAYAVLDPALGRLRYACAGHPPPVVRVSQGDASLLMSGRSAPLAASPSITRTEAEVMLTGDTSLLLYSDGLFERRGEPLDVGLERLRQAVSARATLDPERFCDELIEEMLAGKPAADDVALLIVQPLGQWGSCLVRRFRARPEELARMRQAARSWLTAAGVSRELGNDALLAVDEAAANAIEHAYLAGDGDVEIELRQDGGELVVAVRDFGRWREPPAPGERGHGIRIMRHFAHELEFERRGNGTTVHMRRRLRSDGSPRHSGAISGTPGKYAR